MPVRMTIIKNMESNKCWWEIRTFVQFWKTCKMVQPPWNRVHWFLKKPNTINKIATFVISNGMFFSHKSNEAFIHTTMWINLYNMVVKWKTTQKLRCMLPFLWNIQNRQIPSDGKYINSFQRFLKGYGMGEWMFYEYSTGFHFGMIKIFWN